MNDRQLKSFILATETGSFTKAAKKSYISASSLIQQINLLEEDLGFDLFVRTNHGISLSDEGLTFYQDAKKILEIYENAKTEHSKKRRLRILVAESQIPDILIPAMDRFSKKYPDLIIDIIHADYNRHLDLLRRKEADLTVIAKPKEELLQGLIYCKLAEDYYSFVMAKDHPLSNKSIIAKNDLKDYDLVVGNYDYLLQDFTETLHPYVRKISCGNAENDLKMKLDSVFKKELMVIHSQWKSNYLQHTTVIPSNISAGEIGVVVFENKNTNETFIQTLKQVISHKKL